MPAVRNLIVGVDLEPGSAELLDAACAVAKPLGVEVILHHVVTLKSVPEFGDDSAADRDRAVETCQRMISERAGATDFGPPRVSVGDPEAETLRVLREVPDSLLFLGYQHQSPLERFLDPSLVSEMFWRSPRPVWVNRPSPAPGRRPSILCAVDTRRPRSEVLDWGIYLARGLGAELQVIRALSEEEEETPRAPEQLDEVRCSLASVDLHGMEVHPVASESPRGRRLIDAAADGACSLLIMGPKGRRSLLNWLGSDRAESLVRDVNCDLLAIGESAR